MSEGVAVIVGAGPGLGSALVRRLCAEGFRVIAAARDGERLARLVAALPESTSVDSFACDASVPGQVDALFGQVAGKYGPPELVVYNVGSLERGGIAELDAARFEAAWRSICFGGFLVGRATAALMRPAGRGTLIYTGATSALRGRAGFAASAASRAGLRALAQSLARELGPEGIHVAHVIIDGGIYRPEYAERLRDLPPDALLQPEAIAGAYLELHRQHRSAWTQELDLRPWVEKF